jgi:hypothetical protein
MDWQIFCLQSLSHELYRAVVKLVNLCGVAHWYTDGIHKYIYNVITFMDVPYKVLLCLQNVDISYLKFHFIYRL